MHNLREALSWFDSRATIHWNHWLNTEVMMIDISQLSDDEKKLVIAGFIHGYENGHNDTVESCFGDSEECAIDWLNKATEDGGLEYAIDQLTGHDCIFFKNQAD